MTTGPFCRCCGKPLPKLTRTIYWRREPSQYDIASAGIGYVYTPEPPDTIEDCRKLTNGIVVSVSRARYGDAAGKIGHFHVWDGESYKDPEKLFCGLGCAAEFGRAAARLTGTYGEPRITLPAWRKAIGREEEKA